VKSIFDASKEVLVKSSFDASEEVHLVVNAHIVGNAAQGADSSVAACTAASHEFYEEYACKRQRMQAAREESDEIMLPTSTHEK
jgi:hypothetical protein